MPNFPIVFIRGTVVLPKRTQGSRLKRLNYAELKALRDAVGGGDIVARTPDHQARRFEFKGLLLEDLEKRARGASITDTRALSQFKALVEGVIYGHLRIKLYDQRSFNLDVSDQLRYLGVLINQKGRVLGGTDPHLLFFAAANLASFDLGELEKANNGSRDTNAGTAARELLRGFKETLRAQSLWQPDQILWMSLLDSIFFPHASTAEVDLDNLRTGWKTVGPIMLQVSIGSEQQRYRPFYLPVFEEGYQRKALISLSGDVTPNENVLHLSQGDHSLGSILMPRSQAVPGQDLLLLGAGGLEPKAIGGSKGVQINYEQLRHRIQNILNPLIQSAEPVRRIAQESPFSYPDVIRLPVQHDGFVAVERFRLGRTIERFGGRFIECIAGKGVLDPPSKREGDTPPCLVVGNGDHYFIDKQQDELVYYVESYSGETIEELTAVGYVLWCVFDRNATISDDRTAVIRNGEAILHFTGLRFQPSPRLQLEWPNVRQKAATLQRLKGIFGRSDGPPLFREAIKRWLEKGYGDIVQQPSNPSLTQIGPFRWYLDNY